MTAALTALVWIALAYAGIGVVFALVFVALVVERYDPAAKGTGKGFRLLILPGVAALWPMFVLRLVCGRPGPPVERGAHRVR